MEVDGEGECLPLEIRPHISIADYEIQFDKQERKIKMVRNGNYGPVLFRAVSIDADAGYV